MKLLIASDIHGSATYTRRLLQAIDSERPDLVALLGDVYNHGPRNPLPEGYAPLEVAEMLNEIKDDLIVIRGNCDSEVDQMISRFHFVESAAVWADGKRIFLTHGHVFNRDALPAIGEGDTLAYGHFHRACLERVGAVNVLNPGSISLPKDGVRAYIVVENSVATLVDIDRGPLETLSL